MKKNLNLLLALALCLAFLLLARPALAQADSATRFSEVMVEIWPEYDQPGVLVMYTLTLSPDVTLPAQVNLRLPLSATLNAAAEAGPQGNLLNVTYNLTQSAAWQTLSFQASARQLRVEYYDAGLQRQGQQRNFRYDWPGDFAVEAVRVQVQQPYDAGAMQVLPGPAQSQTFADGLTYYIKEIGAVAANQAFSLDITYNKESDRLSAEFMSVQPSAPLPSDTALNAAAFDWQSLAPWLLAGLGLALIGGGVWWYTLSGRQSEGKADHSQRARPRRKESPPPPAETTGSVYCQQCGRRSAESDRFCRACGARLRLK